MHERRSALPEVLRLRREQHQRMASASTYSLLRRAADAVDAWDIERDAVRLALRERDLGGLIDALLSEGDVEGAWSVAHEDPSPTRVPSAPGSLPHTTRNSPRRPEQRVMG